MTKTKGPSVTADVPPPSNPQPDDRPPAQIQVSIVVPTLNRPEPLRRALRSAAGQRGIDAERVEILVVDNSLDGNARAGVTALAAELGRDIRLIAMPDPGVANARNAGVAAARGTWVAFLDDDEEAAPDWLCRHLANASATGAAAVFGPVEPKPEAGGDLAGFGRYFDRHIDRPDGADITDLAAYLGTNNSVFDRAKCLAGPAPFDGRLNGCGGEDSLLLAGLVRSGHRFAWSAEAPVIEWVPPRRLTWSYVYRRKRLSGQVRSFVLAMLRPPDRLGVGKWMAIGAVQLVLAGGLAALLRPIARQRSRHFWATAMGGLGKIFWMARFRPGLYGRGLVS